LTGNARGALKRVGESVVAGIARRTSCASEVANVLMNMAAHYRKANLHCSGFPVAKGYVPNICLPTNIQHLDDVFIVYRFVSTNDHGLIGIKLRKFSSVDPKAPGRSSLADSRRLRRPISR